MITTCLDLRNLTPLLGNSQVHFWMFNVHITRKGYIISRVTLFIKEVIRCYREDNPVLVVLELKRGKQSSCQSENVAVIVKHDMNRHTKEKKFFP